MTAGWAPAIAAGRAGDEGGHWVSAGSRELHLWSGRRLERSVELAALLGGPPRVLPDGRILAGRYAIDAATGEAIERLPFEELRRALKPGADPNLFEIREVAWSRDGEHALVLGELVPTRVGGASDELEPGAVLGLAHAQGGEIAVLDAGRFLIARPLAGDRWLVAGGRMLRVYAPESGAEVLAVSPDDPATAVATVDDVVAAGLSGGAVVVASPPDAAALQQWPRHAAVIDAVAVSPDGRLVASGDRDGDLQVWAVDGSAQLLGTGVGGRVDGLGFLSADHLVVAVGGPNRDLLHLDLPA